MLITTVKERPILFSGSMVRAILDDKKTQTRRIVKPQPTQRMIEVDFTLNKSSRKWSDLQSLWTCPCGRSGDRLWVRETFCQKCEDGYPVYTADGNLDSSCYHYRADGYHVVKADGDGGTEFTKGGREASPWKPSIFMPRHASRITLEVTAIRVERLQEITETDAVAEGAQCAVFPEAITYRWRFAKMWNQINGAGSWDANPWVWVVTFKRVNA